MTNDVRHGRSRVWVFALAVLLLALAIGAGLWGSRDAGENSDADADEAALPANLSSWGTDSAKENSSAERFMDDLARKAVAVESGAAAASAQPKVFWKSDTGLVESATEVLERYADIETASLSTSGYLDLNGSVWGAIVSDSRGWVDMVTVVAGENDETSEVRAVRLLPAAE